MRIRAWTAAAFSILIAATALAGEEPPARSITVAGKASIMAAPDLARIHIAVEHRDSDMRTARDSTVGATRDFLALARKLGIPDRNIQTSGLTIQPEHRWDEKNGRQVFIGYFVRRQINVALHDLERLGELLEGAMDLGVNQISPPELDSSRRDEIDRSALAAAAKDARANAERIATSLGVTLGPLRTLDAVNAGMPVPRMRMASMQMADSAAESYIPGEIESAASVTATFDVLID